MDIQSVGPYSPNTVYGEFTSPFTPKPVTIHATTSYDEQVEAEEKAAKSLNGEEEEIEENVFTRSYFYGNVAPKYVYEDLVPKIPPENQNNNENKEDSETQSEVSSFSSSNVKDDSIVRKALRNGYSNNEALVINKAREAYKNNGIITKDPIKALSTREYQVF